VIQLISRTTLASAGIERPIFVVGCCNSGTTILWQALKTHPELDGPLVEGQDLADLPPCMKHCLGRQTFRLFAHPRFRMSYRRTEVDFDWRTGHRIASVYREHCRLGKRLIEKSPANTLRVRYLQSIFPDAYFVFIVRSGLAVSEGIVRKRWLDPERPQKSGQSTTLADAATQWLHANAMYLYDQRYLRRSKIVTYEQLVQNARQTLWSVLEFCELDPSDFRVPNFRQDLNRSQIARLRPQEIHSITAITSRLARWTR
jgi:hypothetical protein